VLALAQVHLGQLPQARLNAQAAVAEFKAHIWQEREAVYVLALIETSTGHHPQSEQLLRQTLGVSEPTLTELCQSLLAFNLLCQHRADEALDVSAQAYAEYPDIAADLPVQQVAWVHAQILWRLGRTEEALQALAQAQAVMHAFMQQLKPEQQTTYRTAFAYNRAIEAAVKGQWPHQPVLL
jgi:tetratricopeptide (TPR) repeat protein